MAVRELDFSEGTIDQLWGEAKDNFWGISRRG